ncbi:hypothetical protein FHR95_001592 [Halomonas fontilapidosi]|uniref:Uncharacterized protein n=1 Tax=Halomonas fontilapidosi TaxID=616675 RepID=A0A7W5DJD7_9GAMM|nr:hypothetical protein [Halomonas fontilapidosi]MBB3184032.1 hypothetical protein [Halomonas fontilapidosi]
MTTQTRLILAVVTWGLAAMAVVLPLVWLINNRDWGIGLMLLTPFVVYGLMRLGRALEGWARASSPPPRP